MNISKNVWKDISDILKKNKIPYTTHYEHRDVQRAMEYSDATIHDLHVSIKLVIPDYFEESD